MVQTISQAALVTGGSQRIGRAIVLALAECGYDVAIHYNSSVESASRVADEALEMGSSAATFKCDLSDESEVVQLIPTVLERFPNLGVLVNNASIFERGNILETDEDLLTRHLDVNLKAPFMLTRYLVKSVAKGQIINLVDARVRSTPTGFTAYTVSKFALEAFNRIAAIELGPNFRVNAIAPGLILPHSAEVAEVFEERSKRTALKKTGTTQNVVSALLYLLDNDFVTGELLAVDGGEWL